MDITILDNPIWYSLNSYHRHLAIWGDIAARYQPDIAFGGGMSENTALGFDDLRSLVEIDDEITVLMTLPDDLPGWEVLRTIQLPQMICDDLKPRPHVETIYLTHDDVPDMLDLVALTQPGPFLPRTIELGQYLGLRRDGQLVAMAGERMHLMGFCEISAVCTHPDYRGRGYGGALTTMVAEVILKRQEVPFLHLSPTNDVAMKLYKKLGFRQRREINVARLKRLA
jgi:ribosomal protein S18 acetylase RimI-like enzyme